MKTNETKKITNNLDDLMASVCKVSGFKKDTLLSSARFKEIAEFRMMFYYLAVKLLGARLDEISAFTGRTPATVLSGYRRISDLLMYYDVKSKVKMIKYDFLSSHPTGVER